MHERRFHGEVEPLRSPERLARLEVDRVIQRALQGADIRSVLDVGTGSGVFAEAFAKAGLDTEGLDASPVMLAAAQRCAPGIRWQAGTAEALPYGDATFDLVFMGLLLHETDDRLQALREAARVARKRVAVLEWPQERQEFGPPQHERLSVEEVTSLAIQAGLATAEVIRLAALVLYCFNRATGRRQELEEPKRRSVPP
jgi:ubiquinone/menaquinone biosynthesis C-methylase UbiE